MDFKKLYFIIKKNLKFILIFTAAIIIVVEVFSWYFSGGYDVSVSLYVFSKVSQPTQDYQYDGYYSVKAADEFGNTVAQWTKSSEIISAIYKKAGLSVPAKPLSVFSKIIKAQKMAPQYVETKFWVAKPEDAGKIAKALGSVLQEKADLASQYSGNVVFTIVGGEPMVIKNQANFLFNGLIALIGGFLLAVFVVLLREAD